MGCDELFYREHNDRIYVERAREYVKVGTMAKPPDEFALTDIVDVFETRPFHGRVRVTLSYSLERECGDEKTVTLTLDVPSEGVCCPSGDECCGSEGRAGG